MGVQGWFMDLLLVILFAASVTLDNVVIAQVSVLPVTRLVIISALVHVLMLAGGSLLAPSLALAVPSLAHWLTPCLFTVLGVASLWSMRHHRQHPETTSMMATVALCFLLASDALLLGLSPAVAANLGAITVGVVLFTSAFVLLGRIIRRGGAPVLGRIGFVEAAVFFGLAIHSWLVAGA
jgi:putative Mn2+ efflux pump MntP